MIAILTKQIFSKIIIQTIQNYHIIIKPRFYVQQKIEKIV